MVQRSTTVSFSTTQLRKMRTTIRLRSIPVAPLRSLSAGWNNITTEPGLVSASHLSNGSPCRGAGYSGHATGTDIDGQAWLDPPSIGCDEYYSETANRSARRSL